MEAYGTERNYQICEYKILKRYLQPTSNNELLCDCENLKLQKKWQICDLEN